jgi:hypothetical protein
MRSQEASHVVADTAERSENRDNCQQKDGVLPSVAVLTCSHDPPTTHDSPIRPARWRARST